ncbi:MAG TPA: VanW family protein [Chloroflexota bacterium]|nr:VanW family protein [Chloroflexota bacterium]
MILDRSVDRQRRTKQRKRDVRTLVSLVAVLIGLALTVGIGARGVFALAPRVTDLVELGANMFRSPPPPEPLGLVTPVPTTIATNPISRSSPTPTVALRQTPVVTPTPSRPLAYDPSRLRDSLGRATVAYSGLPAEQVRNIEAAVVRLNGVSVAPGQVLSFNDVVFDPADAIAAARSSPTPNPTRTVVPFVPLPGRYPPPRLGVAVNDLAAGSCFNGLCYVATALFQAGFGAGFTIVERHPHPTWNARFGPAGQDALVSFPQLDLRLRNTTGDWVRVEAWADGRSIGVGLTGVNPGWIVVQPPPVVTAIVPANVNPIRREDLTLDVGRNVFLEEAADGFDAIVTRTVLSEGRVVDEYRQYDRYRPARNVVAIGLKGATATPTNVPTATPVPSVTPPVTSVTGTPAPIEGTPPVPGTAPEPATPTPQPVPPP